MAYCRQQLIMSHLNETMLAMLYIIIIEHLTNNLRCLDLFLYLAGKVYNFNTKHGVQGWT